MSHKCTYILGRIFYIDHNTKTTTWEKPDYVPPAYIPPPSSINNTASPGLNEVTSSSMQPVARLSFESAISSISDATFSPTAVEVVPVSIPQQISASPSVQAMPIENLTSTVVSYAMADISFTPNLDAQINAISNAIDITRGTAYFEGNLELQQIAVLIVPYKMPDKMGLNCLKCKCKFATISILQKRHHCRSCGFIFCNDCSTTMLSLSLTGDEYKKTVRCCDYCAFHLKANDQNSMLRYFGILKAAQTAGEDRKIPAAKALLMSIEHEHAAMADSGHMNVQSRPSTSVYYPALFAVRYQLGIELDSLWDCILPNLGFQQSVKLRTICYQIIIGLVSY